MHRGGLLLVLARQILVCDRIHPWLACRLYPAAPLDPFELGELRSALLRPSELDEERDLPVAAIGDQRVVGGELIGDPLRLEDALDAQHLLDLILNGETILEGPGHVGTDLELARSLVREKALAECRPLARVLLEGHEIACGERLHRP